MTNVVEKQWVVLELSRLGERESPEDLVAMLRRETGDDLEIFIPSKTFVRKGNRITICLMEGYMFLEGGKSAGFYLDLEYLPFISKALTKDEKAGRFLLYVPDSEIIILKEKLKEETRSEIHKNDEVCIIGGVYENLEGVVVDFNPLTAYAMVSIQGLSSIDTIVELPFQFLERKND
jgi:transcription antitermination factor NusG